jgi:PiT family inorganic phosphate transporter
MTLGFFSVVIILAFIFALTAGFIDGGGLVATVITTRALEPFAALMVVALCEIVGLFLLGQAVVRTLAHKMVTFPPHAVPLQVLIVLSAGLLGALLWNTSMWRLALPSSSSHALVGGLVGAVLAVYGRSAVFWPAVIKIVILLGVVPAIGAILGYLFSRLIYWLGEFMTPAAGKIFKGLQVIALAGMAMVHGSNDGQKCLAMMLLAVLVVRSGKPPLMAAPWPLIAVCGAAMALGVIFGSRRIISTVGKRLYRVEGLQGFCAETSAMLLVGTSSLLGYPMSTTHVMSTSVLGAGVAVHPRGVRWDLVGEIGLVWLVTIPSSALVGAGLAWIANKVVPGV